MGNTAHDSRPAMATCVKGHVFKDATLPDGKPNPKPMIVETPGVWEFKTYKEVKEMALKVGTYVYSNSTLQRVFSNV